MPPPISGPITGTRAYPQSEPPLFLIGKTACATRGAKSRAGLIAYPVGPPRLKPIPQTRIPQNHGLNPGARPVGANSLLPKLKPTTTRQVVKITSHKRLRGSLRIAGWLQKTDSFVSGSGVSLQCGKYTIQTSTAPTNPPKNCAAQNWPTFDQFFESIATASVTAGLICPPGLPQATAVQIPATTAMPQAVAITIHPEFSPLVFFSWTFATTPSPNKTNTIVPMNSPTNGPCIQPPLPRIYFGIPIHSSRNCGSPLSSRSDKDARESSHPLRDPSDDRLTSLQQARECPDKT